MTLRDLAPTWWGWIGLLVLAAAGTALALDLPGLNLIWYVPAWYGYLLVLDSAIHRLRGRSFLTHGRRELAAMLFWSVPFWYLFEAYNLVLQNWYYVFGIRSDRLEGLFTVLAFATVFPACFFHHELLAAMGIFRDLRCRPLRVDGPVTWFFAGFGGLCVVLPLLLPRPCFWMVWGATLGIPEVLNRRSGAPSLLEDLARGEPARPLRLLAGGMIAGLVWEGFNSQARCKWIYTVPGFEDWKLFEMPLAGFLGFPVLTVAAFAGYALLCHHLREGRHWELGPRGTPECSVPARGEPRVPLVPAGIPARRALLGMAIALSITFSIWTHGEMVRLNLRSRRPLLNELEAIGPDEAGRLVAAGLPTPELFVREMDRHGLEATAGRTGIPAAVLARAHRHGSLALHKGMGAPAAGALRAAGVERPEDLAGMDPGALHARLRELALRQGTPEPRRSEVAVWIRAARPTGGHRR